MVGLGEDMDELLQVCRDLAARKVDILTIGQYLAPSRNHLPVKRMYPPEEFAFLKQEADKMGFQHVESGPLVRSSYHAHEQAAEPNRASLKPALPSQKSRRFSLAIFPSAALEDVQLDAQILLRVLAEGGHQGAALHQHLVGVVVKRGVFQQLARRALSGLQLG